MATQATRSTRSALASKTPPEQAAKQPAAAKRVAPKAPAAVKPPVQALAVDNKPPKIKHKLVRDSFTMPKADFDLIAGLKERAIGFKRPAKKSELLRAGLHVLASLSDVALKNALGLLETLKPGRPKKAG